LSQHSRCPHRDLSLALPAWECRAITLDKPIGILVNNEVERMRKEAVA
jgi:hypothetical protein